MTVKRKDIFTVFGEMLIALNHLCFCECLPHASPRPQADQSMTNTVPYEAAERNVMSWARS